MHTVELAISHENYTIICDNHANVKSISAQSKSSPYVEHLCWDTLGGYVKSRCEQRVLAYFEHLRKFNTNKL